MQQFRTATDYFKRKTYSIHTLKRHNKEQTFKLRVIKPIFDTLCNLIIIPNLHIEELRPLLSSKKKKTRKLESPILVNMQGVLLNECLKNKRRGKLSCKNNLRDFLNFSISYIYGGVLSIYLRIGRREAFKNAGEEE